MCDDSFHDEATSAQALPDLTTQLPVLRAVGAPVVVECNVEGREIAQVSLLHFGNQVDLTAPFLACADHDRRAVRIIGAHEDAPVPAELLEADPDVGLDVLHQMPDVDRTIGVGQGRRYENPSLNHGSVHHRNQGETPLSRLSLGERPCFCGANADTEPRYCSTDHGLAQGNAAGTRTHPVELGPVPESYSRPVRPCK